MSILYFLDSFDHYELADITKKWVSKGNYASLTPSRTGNGATSTRIDYALKLKRGTDPTTIMTVGAAFKMSSMAEQQELFVISNWNMKTAAAGTATAWCNIRPEGTLQVHINGNPADNADGIDPPRVSSNPTSPVICAGIWYYAEFQLNITSPTSVEVIVRINNQVVLTQTLALTWTISWPYVNWARFGGCSPMIIDDVYITNDVFLGDIHIGVIRPESDTATKDWTPSNAGDNFEEVNDINPDGDNSYISSSLVDDIDLYNMQDLGLNGIVKGIQTNILCNKSGAGPATVKAVYELGSRCLGSELFPSATTLLTDDSQWADLRDCQLLNPDTGVAWTTAEIDALVAGVKRVS